MDGSPERREDGAEGRGRTVLLVGADGYLGGAVRSRMQREDAGFEVVNLGLAAPPPGVTGGWLVANLPEAPFDETHGIIAGLRPDVVVNCADAREGDRRRLVDVNVRLVARLIEAIHDGAPEARLVQLGSADEYGRTRRDRAAREDDPGRPCDDHGLTKLVATEMVLTATEERGLDAVVLRIFTPVGAGVPGTTDAGRLALRIRDAVAAGATEVRAESLEAHRDFVDIDDVADAIARACVAPGIAGWVLNVGSGRPTGMRRLAELLCDAAGFGGEVVGVPEGDAAAGVRPWEAADVRRAASVLGWRARTPLEVSARRLWGSTPAGSDAVRGLVAR